MIGANIGDCARITTDYIWRCRDNGVDRPHEQGRRVPVEVEVQKPAVGRDVLLNEIPEERTLAAPGFAEHRNVRRAPRVAHRDMRARHLSVRDAIAEIKTAPFRPCSAFPYRAGG